MIRLRENLWIGGSTAPYGEGNLRALGIHSLLCVAQDLQPVIGWGHGFECMHVGLIDGPGNTPSAYCAVILALHELLSRGKVMVYCHGADRSLAVTIFHAQATCAVNRPWQEWLDVTAERVDLPLPQVNPVHVEAFDKIDWKAMRRLLA